MSETFHAGRLVEILLVEDNEGDVLMTQEAITEADVATHLSVVEDGVEAIRFLRRMGPYTDAPRPDLILLDLNLPRKDGQEVLAEIKADVKLRAIPVVVLTTSQADKDVETAYELNANCYIVKPVDYDRLMEIIRCIEEFWLTVVKLPPRTL